MHAQLTAIFQGLSFASLLPSRRIHGLRSGKLLKEFRGHTSYINCVAFLTPGPSSGSSGGVVTCSSDGTVRCWDVKTTECVSVIKPPQAVATSEAPVLSIVPLPYSRLGMAGPPPSSSSAAGGSRDALLVVSRSGAAHILSTSGGTLRSFSGGPAPAYGVNGHCTFVSGCLSPQSGRWVHLLGDDGLLRTFSTASGQLEAVLPKAVDKGPLGLAHHPLRNLVATFASDGAVRLWKA